jgi:hypothetical protein
MSIAGRTYLERGKPVVVITQWKGKGPRNVAIRRQNGTIVVRPFRGLRKMPEAGGRMTG